MALAVLTISAVLRRLAATVCLSLLAVSSVLGASLDEVRAQLKAGAFLEAVALGEAEGSALGLALAAKAAGYHARCNLKGQPAAQKPFFQQNLDLAQAATTLDPDEAEGWVQKARGYARILNYTKKDFSFDQAMDAVGRLEGYLARASALAPERAEPVMSRGRIEVGKLTASRDLFFGAFSVFGDRDRAIGDFCKAIRLADRAGSGHERTLVYYTIADGLWVLNPKRHAGLASVYADRALEACTDDAICVCIQRDATQLKGQIAAAFPDGPPPAKRICDTP